MWGKKMKIQQTELHCRLHCRPLGLIQDKILGLSELNRSMGKAVVHLKSRFRSSTIQILHITNRN